MAEGVKKVNPMDEDVFATVDVKNQNCCNRKLTKVLIKLTFPNQYLILIASKLRPKL